MTTCLSERGGRQRLRRALLCLVLGMGLMACAGTGDGSGSGEGRVNGLALLGGLGPGGAGGTGRTRAEVPLAGGALRLLAPDGWCIEPRSHRNAAGGSFALVAGCREVTAQDDYETSPRGYATVVVGPFHAEGVAAETLLREVLGGAPGTLQRERGGLVLVKPPETGEGPAWRGALDLGGWPVMIAVFDAGNALVGDRGARMVRDLAAGLRVARQSAALPGAAPDDPA